jgi:hypothetical protein
MKFFIICLFSVSFLLGCQNSQNELTTKLLNEKKMLEDSLSICKGGEQIYLSKAKEVMHATHDTLLYNPLVDSSTYFFGKGLAVKQRLKDIDFSLDSLSKMK